MRPFCKMAREAAPDDPHWVTKLMVDKQAQHSCQLCVMQDGYHKVNSNNDANNTVIANSNHINNNNNNFNNLQTSMLTTFADTTANS